MTKSKIEWTDRVWNPVRGCSLVSEGCKNCYAMHQAHRFSGDGMPFEGLTKKTNRGAKWTGKVEILHDKLDEPKRWKKPSMVFVNSMSDLFHEDVSFHFISEVFFVMKMEPQHTFQILTKRPERMLEFVRWQKSIDKSWNTSDNVWLGVSVEDQKTANERIPILLEVPAAVRFLSCEPLLGPVDIQSIEAPDDDDAGATKIKPLTGQRTDMARPCRDTGKINWVIVGGESGDKARPMHPDWVRSLRDQCNEHDVPFFFKQWGEYLPHCLPFRNKQHWINKASGWLHPQWRKEKDICIDAEANHILIGKDFDSAFYPVYPMWKVGKFNSGNLLDGKQHIEFPSVRKEVQNG